MLLNIEKWFNVLVLQAHGYTLGPYWREVKKPRRGYRLARGERVTD
jgi:hypothetical protein